jgi:hypothetical protein
MTDARTHVLTVCTLRTLPHALVLREGLRAHQPDWALHIGLVDPVEAVPAALRSLAPVLSVRSIALPDFDGLAGRYTQTELTNLTKPFFARYLLDTQPDLERLVYLAPETQVLAPLTALTAALDTHQLVLTSRLHAVLRGAAGRAEKTFLNAGTYQQGCWALRRGETADAFLNWWADRLYRKGWLRLCEGFGSDQLWLDLVPAHYEGVYLLRTPGYAVTPANRHEYPLTPDGTGYRFGTEPLTTVYWRDESPLLPIDRAQAARWRQLKDAYRLRLAAFGEAELAGRVPTWGLPDPPPPRPRWRRAAAWPFRQLSDWIGTYQPDWLYPAPKS